MRLIPSLPTFDPLTLLARPRRQDRFPFGAGGHAFNLARAGVYRAVRAFLRGGEGVVLMPAYHHGVEVEAVRATGAEIQLCRVDRDLRVDLDDLRARLRDPRVRVVYVTHFVGFAQDMAAIAALCHAREVPIVEDCALALLSRDPQGRPLGTTGDAAIFCLYKTLPVPHGGLLITQEKVAGATTPAPLAATVHHAAGLALAHAERHWPGGRQLRAWIRLAAQRAGDRVVEAARTGTQHIAPGDLDRAASRIVPWIVARLDLDDVIARRRRNFERMAAALADEVDVVGAPLAAGVCPLFLPVRVSGDKPAFVRELARDGIEAIDFWSQATAGEPVEVTALRREILELPCHQGLDDEDADRVVDRFLAVARRRQFVSVGTETNASIG